MIYIIISLISISYLFINAEPLIMLKRMLGFKEEKYDEYGDLKQFIYRLITCWMCSCFWISTIILIILNFSFLNILFISSISATLSSLIEKRL